MSRHVQVDFSSCILQAATASATGREHEAGGVMEPQVCDVVVWVGVSKLIGKLKKIVG